MRVSFTLNETKFSRHRWVALPGVKGTLRCDPRVIVSILCETTNVGSTKRPRRDKCSSFQKGVDCENASPLP